MDQDQDDKTENGEVRIEPLWKNLLNKLNEIGIEQGMTWPIAFFEKELSQSYGTLRFGIDIFELREALIDMGFYLSQDGEHFVIVMIGENVDIARKMQAKANRYTQRQVRLLDRTLNLHSEKLTESERNRVSAALERASIRLALMQRTEAVRKIVEKTNKDLLNPKRKALKS